MIVIIKHAVDAIFSFSNMTHQRTAHGTCSTVKLLHCKTSFLRQLWPQQPKSELNWLQCKIYGVVRHHECGLQASSMEEIRQQVAELRQTINTVFERSDFHVSLFPRVEQSCTVVRWGRKTNHHSVAYPFGTSPPKITEFGWCALR